MDDAKLVILVYHREDEGWWAESANLPGFTAAGADFEEVRRQAREGVQTFAGEAVILEEGVPAMVTQTGAGPTVPGSFSLQLGGIAGVLLPAGGMPTVSPATAKLDLQQAS